MMRLFALLVACLVLDLPSEALSFEATGEQRVGVGSFVVFNTQCANCHEGQCSRRLCLSSKPEEAADHIRQYTGKVSHQTINELYHQLTYMKQRCSYFPVDTPGPKNGMWNEADLAALTLQSREGCFIPLGTLARGPHSMQLLLKERSRCASKSSLCILTR